LQETNVINFRPDAFIPYGRQSIDENDINAVIEVLQSNWLTSGPKISEFEAAVADYAGAQEAVAVSSGTAALHAAIYALNISVNDEVILPPITFAATANAIIYQGGTPVLADVSPDTLLIDPAQVEKRITDKTKAIIGVDYSGHPCDYDALRAIAEKYGLYLIADSCHAIGALYKDQHISRLADLTVLSFHPVKHITTGEGGMVLTNIDRLVERMRRFRNHGIDVDASQRQTNGSWHYQITDTGFNYRLTDIQCALGLSQMKKLPVFLARRRQIAGQYDRSLLRIKGIVPLTVKSDVRHAYHLYVIRVQNGLSRRQMFQHLREAGIGVNVHYIPIHHHPYYQKTLGYQKGDFPVADTAYEEIISLPIFPDMTDGEVETVLKTINMFTRTQGGEINDTVRQ